MTSAGINSGEFLIPEGRRLSPRVALQYMNTYTSAPTRESNVGRARSFAIDNCSEMGNKGKRSGSWSLPPPVGPNAGPDKKVMRGGSRQRRVPKRHVRHTLPKWGARAACRQYPPPHHHQNPRRADPPRTPSAVAATARAAAPSCALTPDSTASADAAEPSVRRANADVAAELAERSVSQYSSIVW